MPATNPLPPQGRRQRTLCLVLCIGLVAAVGAATALGVLSQRYYRELQATRLHPLGLAFLEPTADDHPLIAYVGDSRVEEWRPTGHAEGTSVANLGLDTQTTAQVRLRWEHHVTPLAPEVIVLQVGINDLKAVALFPELRLEIVDDCVRNIGAMVSMAVDSGSRVVLTTIVPPGPIPLWRRPVWSPDVRRAVDEVNRRLADMMSPGVDVVDLSDVLCERDGSLRPGMSRDALHLAPEAYAAIDRALQPVLRRSLAAPRIRTKITG